MKPISPIVMLSLNLSLLFCFVAIVTACSEPETKSTKSTATPVSAFNIGKPVAALGKDIDCIFQDKDNNFWFASNGEGVFRYDGKTLRQITDKDGLCSNFVWNIQEDLNGYLWFTTRDVICRFDGKTMTNFTDTIKNAPTGAWRYQQGGLFFGHFNGVCYYNGTTFTNFTISPPTYAPDAYDNNRPYSVYSTWADKAGNVWFGTQEKGVCLYDGKNFTYLTDKDLAGPAVRSIYQDKAGVLWFGNNGGGLFRYDGKELTNITEERGLVNYEFLRGKKLVNKAGSLARVFALNQDQEGNLWVGTIDAGLWKYDGKNLTNFTTKDGLPGNAVNVIYKDKKGELWFVTDGTAICKFNGKSFTPFEFAL